MKMIKALQGYIQVFRPEVQNLSNQLKKVGTRLQKKGDSFYSITLNAVIYAFYNLAKGSDYTQISKKTEKSV